MNNFVCVLYVLEVCNFSLLFQPKFLTKAERAVEALKRRQEEAEEIKKRQEEERVKRLNFEREAEDSRKSDRDRDRDARRRERERDRQRDRERERERDRESRGDREGGGRAKEEKPRATEVSLISLIK